jgi:hypothetical protein
VQAYTRSPHLRQEKFSKNAFYGVFSFTHQHSSALGELISLMSASLPITHQQNGLKFSYGCMFGKNSTFPHNGFRKQT